MARIEPYFRDPKLYGRCFIPIIKLEEAWGPETHFLVRKNSAGEFVKSDYEKWKIEEMARLGLQMTSKDYKNSIVADIIEEIIKNVFKRELEQILNCSDSSYNENFSFSFSSCNDESFNSSKQSYDLKNLSINANFDTSNLGKKRKTKVKVNYADSDIEEVPVTKIQPSRNRKSRKKVVGIQTNVYAHITASIPENHQHFYQNNPQASYQNEFKLEPKVKPKRKPRQSKQKKPIYNEQVKREYTETIDAVAGYKCIQETLKDEVPQIITPEIYGSVSQHIPEDILEDILEDIPVDTPQILPERFFNSLPSLTDSPDVDRFLRDSKTTEFATNSNQIVQPVAEFVLEPSGSNFTLQPVNQVNGKVLISFPLPQNHQPFREDRKNENVSQKRKADEPLRSQEKRRKYANQSTQTDRDFNRSSATERRKYTNHSTQTDRDLDKSAPTIINNLHFYPPITSTDVETLRGVFNQTNSTVTTTAQPVPIPKKSIVSRERTTKASTSKQITNSWKEKPKAKVVDKEIKKPVRITSIRRSVTETTTKTSSSQMKKKIDVMPIRTLLPEKVPVKPLIETPSSTSTSSSNESDSKTSRSNKNILHTNSSQLNEEKSSSFNTPEKIPFNSLIKTPSSTSSLSGIKESIDGTEIEIEGLDEFNLSLLGSGTEITLDNNMGSIIDELSEFVDIKNNDQVNEEVGTNLDISETHTASFSSVDKKNKKWDSLSDDELDYNLYDKFDELEDVIDLNTEDELSDLDEIPTPTKNMILSEKGNQTKTLSQITTAKKNYDFVSPDVFANVTPTTIRNIPKIPKKVSLIEIKQSDLRLTTDSLNLATISNMDIKNTLFQKKNVNDPRINGGAVKYNKNISIENSTLSLNNQRIIDNVNEAMAERARKREEEKLINNNKVLYPPIISKESLPIQPLLSLKIKSPVERSTLKINIVFDSICYTFYKGNCNVKKCKFNHQLPTDDIIRDRLKTLNKSDFLEIYKVCVSMTKLLKQSWVIFIEVATFNKWNQFLDYMIEMSDVYPLEDINKMWRAVFHAFTECNLTKQESVSQLIKLSGNFRKLPQVEVLIDLMVETNLQFFLKEITYFIKLFNGYQANAFVIERFYEAAVNNPDREFLKLAHGIAVKMNPIEACNVDPVLITRFCETYFTMFPGDAS